MTPEEKKARQAARYRAWAAKPENQAKIRERARIYAAKKRASDPEGSRVKSRAYREKNKDRLADRELRRAYGIGLADFVAMYEAQGGKCAICADDIPAYGRARHVDHCHSTGRVRGILCGTCNRGIGQFRDRPDLCLAAAAYLTKDRT